MNKFVIHIWELVITIEDMGISGSWFMQRAYRIKMDWVRGEGNGQHIFALYLYNNDET